MGMKYTLYIGTGKDSQAADILQRYDVHDFTLYHTIGYWKGEPEAALAVDIVSETTRANIQHIARMLGRELRQSSVLVAASPVDSQLVECMSDEELSDE